MKTTTDLTGKKKSEIISLIRERAKTAYEAGPGWGKARDGMLSFGVRHFLTPEDEADVEQAKNEAYARFISRISAVPKSVLNKNSLDPDWLREDLVFSRRFEDRYPGVRMFVECVEPRYVRGRRIADIVPVERTKALMYARARRAGEVRFERGVDELGRPYIDFIDWPVSAPVPESLRRKNWARSGKLREFQKAAVDFARRLVDAGYAFKSEVKDADVFGSSQCLNGWRFVMEKTAPNPGASAA